jgi:DNA-binding MarR family transcriptional regulator
MPTRQTVFALNELIAATRRLADMLRETAQRIHVDSDLSVAERAVLFELRRHGPLTVPELARRRGVTRQSTQTTVNPLLARGVLRRAPNPAHRRSPLIELTPDGVVLIRKVMRREGDLLADLSRDLEVEELRQAREALERVAQALRQDARDDGAETAEAPAAPQPPRAKAAEGA